MRLQGAARGSKGLIASPARVFWILLPASATASAGAQNLAAGWTKHGICASCHGIEGRSFKKRYPILAGQSERYLLLQINDFKVGRRHDSGMETIVPQLSTQNIRDLAAFFASLRPRSSRFNPDSGKAARGRAKAAKMECGRCHPVTANYATYEPSRIAGQQFVEDFRLQVNVPWRAQ
jgi:cytochrome c553